MKKQRITKGYNHRIGDTVFIFFKGQKTPVIIEEMYETRLGKWYIVCFDDHICIRISEDDII